MSEKEKLINELMKSLVVGGKDEAYSRAIIELTNTEKIRMLSNLSPFEDDELAIIQLIGEIYNINFLKSFVDLKLQLRCSVYGWRANQIASIVSEIKKTSIFAKIFKRKSGEKGIEGERRRKMN